MKQVKSPLNYNDNSIKSGQSLFAAIGETVRIFLDRDAYRAEIARYEAELDAARKARAGVTAARPDRGDLSGVAAKGPAAADETGRATVLDETVGG